MVAGKVWTRNNFKIRAGWQRTSWSLTAGWGHSVQGDRLRLNVWLESRQASTSLEKYPYNGCVVCSLLIHLEWSCLVLCGFPRWLGGPYAKFVPSKNYAQNGCVICSLQMARGTLRKMCTPKNTLIMAVFGPMWLSKMARGTLRNICILEKNALLMAVSCTAYTWLWGPYRNLRPQNMSL